MESFLHSLLVSVMEMFSAERKEVSAASNPKRESEQKTEVPVTSNPKGACEQDKSGALRRSVPTIISGLLGLVNKIGTGTLASVNNGAGDSLNTLGNKDEGRLWCDPLFSGSRLKCLVGLLDDIGEDGEGKSFVDLQVVAGQDGEVDRLSEVAGCGFQSCQLCDRQDSVVCDETFPVWEECLVGAKNVVCVKTTFGEFVESLYIKVGRRALPFFSGKGDFSLVLPEVIYFPEGQRPRFQFEAYAVLRRDVHLFRYQSTMMAAFSSGQYDWDSDFRWMMVHAGLLSWCDFHNYTIEELVRKAVCFAVLVPQTWLQWLPWFDLVLFLSFVILKGGFPERSRLLGCCTEHGGRFAWVDQQSIGCGKCSPSCFRVREDMYVPIVKATMDHPVCSNSGSSSSPASCSGSAGVYSAGMCAKEYVYVDPPSCALGVDQGIDEEAEEEKDSGFVPENWSDFFKATAVVGGLSDTFRDVGAFVKQKYATLKTVLGAVSFISDSYTRIADTIRGLGIKKKHLQYLGGIILAFVAAMTVKYLVKNCVPVREVILGVLDFVGDRVGELALAIKEAFKMFWTSEDKTQDALNFEMRDGKFVFTERPPSAPLVGQNVKATSAQIVSALIGGALATTRSKNESLFERVLAGVKLVVPLVAAAGVSTQALYWVFTKLPSCCGEAVGAVLGSNPAQRGNAYMYDLMASAGALTVKFRDGKPEELTLLDARSYIKCYNDITLLIVDASVTAPAIVAGARAVLTAMEPFVDLCKTRLGEESGRATPVGLYFFGKPGIGKSSIIPLIAKGLFPDRSPAERCYTKNLESPYWEGFKPGTPMVYFDEPHAVGGQMAELYNASMLSYISTADVVLNFAGMPDKGKIKLTASVIAMSSNVGPEHEVKGLVCPEAFRRRMMYWRVMLLPQYADEHGLLDDAKIAHFSEEERASLAHLRFVLHRITHFRSGEVDRGEQYCLAEVIDIIKGKIAQHALNYESIKLVNNGDVSPVVLPKSRDVERFLDNRPMPAQRNVVATAGEEKDLEPTGFSVRDSDEKELSCPVVPLDFFNPLPSSALSVDEYGKVSYCAPALDAFIRDAYPDWALGALSWARMMPAIVYNSNVVRWCESVCLRVAGGLLKFGDIERGKIVRTSVQMIRLEDGFEAGKIGIHLASRGVSRAIVDSLWFKQAIEKALAYDSRKGRDLLVGDAWKEADCPDQDFTNTVTGSILEMFGMTPGFAVKKVDAWLQILIDAHFIELTREVELAKEWDNWEFKTGAVTRARELAVLQSRAEEKWKIRWAEHAKKIKERSVVGTRWEMFMASWTSVVEYTKIPVAAIWKHFGVTFSPLADEKIVEGSWLVFQTFAKHLVMISGGMYLLSRVIKTLMRGSKKVVYQDGMQFYEPASLHTLHNLAMHEVRPMPKGDRVLPQTGEVEERETLQSIRHMSKEQMRELYGKGYSVIDAWDNSRMEQAARGGILATSGLTLPAKVRGNQFKVSFRKNGEVLRYMYGLGIVGGVALLPSHFFRVTGPEGESQVIAEELEMIFERNGVVKSLCFEPKRLVHWVDESGVLDLVAYDFGSLIQIFHDIRGLFKSYSNIVNAAGFPALFCKPGDADVREFAKMNLRRQYYSGQNNSGGIAETYIGGYWSYSLKSYGDCGAVLFSEEYGVMGMHTAIELPACARHNGIGMAVRLSKEVVDAFLKKCKVVVACVAPPPGVVETEMGVKMIGDSCLIGKLVDAPAAPLKTKYKALPYAEEDWASHDYLPAAFGQNMSEHRAILRKSYAKLCRPVGHFPQKLVDEAESSIKDLFNTVAPFEKPRLLTENEMLNGGLPHLACVDVHTSAGSQFRKLLEGRPGKRAFIGETKPYALVHPEFNKTLEQNEKLLKMGVIPAFMSDYSLKVEMRSKDRVLVGPGEVPSTRGINVSPFDETLLVRKYFGHFINFMHTTQLEMCIGINVFSNDWNAMILDLLRVSPVGFAMDYSGHETNSTSQMFESFANVVEEYYDKGDSSPEDRDVRRRLLYAICYHLTRVGDMVYMKDEHLMSGCVLTAIMNSFVTMMHFRIAYLVLGRGRPGGASLSDFRKYVCLKVYGDDNIASVAASAAWFNPEQIATVMNSFGIVMTMADKVSAVTQNFDDVCDLQFLKCTTRRSLGEIPGVEYFPRVEEASVIKSLMATHSNIDTFSIVYALGNDCLSRVWSSGAERFGLWRRRIAAVWRRIGLMETPITWGEVERRWFEGNVAEWATFNGQRFHMDILHAPRVRATSDAPLTPALELESTNLVESKVDVPVVEVSSLDGVSSILKRMVPVHRLTGPTTFPVAGLFWGPPFFNVASQFRLYAAAYYGFVGDITLYIVSDDTTAQLTIGLSGDSVIQIPQASTFGALAMVTGPRMTQIGSLMVRLPCLTPNSFIRMPLTQLDVTSGMCSMGQFRVTGGGVGSATIYAALSDQSRFFGLREIPRLSITGNQYPHLSGSEISIAEYIDVVHDDDYELFDPGNQQWANNVQSVISAVSPTTGSAPLTQFRILSSALSDAQLRQLQYNIKDGQMRNYTPGAITRYTSLAGMWAAPLAVNIGGVGAVVERAQYSLPYSSYLAGTFHIIAGQRVLVADQVTVNKYVTVDTRKIADIPNNRVYVRHLNTVTITLPGETLAEDPWRRQVSNEPLWCIRQLPPVVLATATQFAGEVVLHTDGGVASGARNAAIGGLIPEATTSLPERPAVLGTILWTNTDLEGTILAMYENPFDLINVKSAKPAFDASLFWSGEAVLHLKVASNPALAGQLLIFWVAGMNAQQASAHYGGRFSSALLCPHVVMQPNASGVVSFSAPFVHHKMAVRNSDPADVIGTFVIMVQNRLRVGPNAVQNSVTVTTLGSFTQNKFSILNPRVVATGGFVSKAVTNNYNLSHVANAAIDASGAKDSFRGGDVTATNDRPFISLTAPTVLTQVLRNLASEQDVDSGSRLDLKSGGLPQVDSATTGAVTDEMSLRKMRETPSFVGRFTINTEDNVGDLLFKVDLCPGFEFFTVPVGGSFDPCLMTYASLGGTFWRGDIVIDLEFVATVYHAVDLAICSSYVVDTSEADIDTATSQYTTNVHVAGPLTKIRVVFPWTSDTPLKRVCNGNFPVAGDYSMGYAMVRLLSLLQANELVSSTIDCNVYMSMRGDVFFMGNSCMDVSVTPIEVLSDPVRLRDQRKKRESEKEIKEDFEIVTQRRV